MRVALPKCSLKHVPTLRHQPSFVKINQHHLTKPTQQHIDVKFLHNIQPFRAVLSNTQTKWRIVAISTLKTASRGFCEYSKWDDEEEDHKKKKKTFMERFGEIDPGLPKEIPTLIYGSVGSLLVPMLFAVICSSFVLWLVNNDYFTTWAQQKWSSFKKNAKKKPILKESEWYKWSEITKVFSIALALNLVVFCLWQWPAERIQDMLFYYFMHSTLHKHPIGMLLSGISHKSLTHFAFNMVALYSFCGTAMLELGTAQMLGIFTTGCLAASATSHVFKLAIRDMAPSLGASGGVFALVAATTYLNPDMQLSFIFLPFVPFSAKLLLPVLIGFDICGAVVRLTGRRWLGLDHAAHLGGAAFGWFYTQWSVNHMSQVTRLEIAKRKKEKELAEKREENPYEL